MKMACEISPADRSLLSLRAPCRLQACIGERRLEWLLGPRRRGERRADAQTAEQGGCGACGGRRLKKITSCR